MGLTCHWRGVKEQATSPIWHVEVQFGLPAAESIGELGVFHGSIEWLRTWVMSRGCPAFAACAFDNDFAYLVVGADGEVTGELLFDPDHAEALGVIPAKTLTRGPLT